MALGSPGSLSPTIALTSLHGAQLWCGHLARATPGETGVTLTSQSPGMMEGRNKIKELILYKKS